MTLSVRTIPDGLKPRDFLVYSLKPEDMVLKGFPTLVGQLKEIDVSTTGFIRYSMVRLIPRHIDDFYNDGGFGLSKKPKPVRHKHGGHEIVTPGDYILVGKRVPPGWFGVKFGPLQKLSVIKTLKEVSPTALGNWFPYRPDTPTNTRHPWACAFESETDAVTFQAHMTTNT